MIIRLNLALQIRGLLLDREISESQLERSNRDGRTVLLRCSRSTERFKCQVEHMGQFQNEESRFEHRDVLSSHFFAGRI
jgi:hypothetical protein